MAITCKFTEFTSAERKKTQMIFKYLHSLIHESIQEVD